MKILKPDNLALLYRTARIAQRHSLALAMMGHFEFARSDLAQLLPEADLWKAAAQAMGGALLDEGLPKPNGEFKVYGAAHAPQGGQVSQQRVSVRIGSLAKSLVVSGDRHFNALGMPSSPVPYTRMPIEPGTAFGGTGCADNPAGKGYAAVDEGGQAAWLFPNVERESQRVVSRGDRVAPAGFWGYDIGLPQRQQYLGTCDERWLKRDWPHLPDDTQPAFFMSAPSDQWLAGYFTGDEAFEIHHMHPQQAAQHGKLPGLRARCFVYGGPLGQPVLREVRALADTVWLFPELERGIVLYRAVVDVADSDAADVSHVMAEWEALHQPPLPFEHYRERFYSSIQTAPEVEPAGALHVSAPPAATVAAAGATVAVTAPTAAVAAAAPAGDAAAVDAEFAPLHAMVEDLNQQTRELMRRHNLSDADLAPFLEPPPEPAVPTFDELEKMAADLNRQTSELMRKHNLTDADLAPFLKPPPDPADAQALPDLLKQVNDATQASLKKAGLTEADVHAWLRSRPDLAHLADALPPPGSPLPALDADALTALADNAAPVAAAAVPAMASVLPEAAADAQQATEAAPLTREDVIGYHAARRSLAGCDLSGIDLSELDLGGADFSGALLEKTSFAGCRLHDADFSNALLKETDFGAADLQRARLVQSSGGGGKFVKADLRGAQLGKGDFTGADFTQARLAGADAAGALFDQADMTGVDASSCRAEGAQLTGCTLSGTNFSGAALAQANFSGSQLGGSNFSAALCEGADFQGVQAQGAVFADAHLSASRAGADSCFDGARFVRARLDRASWSGAQLRAAVLEHAILDNADLSHAQAGNARFRLASAKGAKFSKADLSGADLTAVNLFKGSLRKATLDGVLLRHANLYGVDFEETRPTIASLEGSNIDRTELRFRPPVV